MSVSLVGLTSLFEQKIMTPYYGMGPRPAAQLSMGPQTIFAIGRRDPTGYVIPLGTGFLVDKTNTVATAAHVVGRSDDELYIILNPTSDINEYQVIERSDLQALPVTIVEYDPIHDLAVLKVKTRDNVKSNIVMQGSDRVNVGSEVITLGYPHLNMGRSVLTHHQASVGAKILLPSFGGNTKSLILNSLSRPGQSGAPVFLPQSNELVGVLIGAYRPNIDGSINVGGDDLSALHQTTHVVSAEYLKGMY